MIWLLIVIPLWTIVNKIFSSLGGSKNLSEYLWNLYVNYYPSANENIKKLRTLQKEILIVHSQRVATSAQDEFSKWAKLSRTEEKMKKEIELISNKISKQSNSFKLKIKSFTWIIPKIIYAYFFIKYRTTPVFWLPKGWFPKFIEWLLSFSSAPIGSVSISAWSFIINWFISDILSLYKDIFITSSSLPASTVNPMFNPAVLNKNN